MIKFLNLALTIFIVFYPITGSALDYNTDAELKMLRQLYREYIPHNRISDDWLSKRNNLKKYFSPELVKLLLEDEDCRVKTGEICAIDSDIIINAQDFDEKYHTTINIDRVNPNLRDRYKVTIDNMGTRTLIFKFLHTNAGLRIDDIIYEPGGSLKKALKEGLAEYLATGFSVTSYRPLNNLRCDNSPLVKGSCFTVTGSFYFNNGWPPYFRIESKEKKLYGIGPIEAELIPEIIRKVLPSRIEGDFELCPFGSSMKVPYEEREFEMVCIQSVKNAQYMNMRTGATTTLK